MAAASGARLAKATVDHFQVEDGSVLRLQQLLSLVDYSPLSWTPSGPPIAPTDAAGQGRATFDPPAGTFAWRHSGWPTNLVSLWQAGHYNVMTKGLVMEFEADHGLDVDGIAGPQVWGDLLQALVGHDFNTGGYDFALGNKTSPESLTIWHDGQVVLKSPANTGIAQDPTPNGTFLVYARLRRQVMRGTNPDGSKYADPVQYVAYFNGGDAVHYLPRADYGIPQSLGCIELPLAQAAQAWPYLAYGTIVSVIG
ncbi:MAG: L,D-transpeptidase family protein [Acidimicrobiales bacterium]